MMKTEVDPVTTLLLFSLFYLHDIFDGGSPPGELVGALGALLSIWQGFPSIAALTDKI